MVKNESKMRRTWTCQQHAMRRPPTIRSVCGASIGQNIMVILIDVLLEFECKFENLFGHKMRSPQSTLHRYPHAGPATMKCQK